MKQHGLFRKSNRLALLIIILLMLSKPAITTAQVGDFNDIQSVAWSPDGTRIAVGGGPVPCDPSNLAGYAIRILDASTGQIVNQLQGHACFVTSVAWSPDGSRLVSASADSTARVWDVSTGQIISQSPVNAPSHRREMWSPDGLRR